MTDKYPFEIAHIVKFNHKYIRTLIKYLYVFFLCETCFLLFSKPCDHTAAKAF